MFTDYRKLGDVRIAATSHYLPPHRVTTAELFRDTPGVDAADLERLTGIFSRGVASPDQATSDLAILAAKPLLATARPEKLYLATVSPDYPSPGTAPLVQLGLGLPPIPAIDIVAACAGFVFGIDEAARTALLSEVDVLVTAAELRSRMLVTASPGVRCLFGDGAAAAIVRKGSGRFRILATHVSADGSGHGAVRVEAGGTRHATTLSTLERNLHTLRMEDGPAVFFAAVEGFVAIADSLLGAMGMTDRDIDVIVPHQANQRILERAARQLRIEPNKWVSYVADMGNIGGASVGVAFDRASKDGRFSKGQRVMLLTAGAGYTAAAAVLEVME